MKTVKLILVQLFVILIAIEIVFRIFGYQPYRVQPYSLVSEPAQCLLPDDRLGFILNEGKFDVTINDSVKYSVTHNAGGERITDFIIKKGASYGQKIGLFGGSFPYGMGVDDSLSYPFLLEKKYQSSIRNKCVPGYGMTQALVELNQDNEFFHTIILHYASFYDDRNALTPEYRVALHHGFMNSNETARSLYAQSTYPYVEKNEAGSFEIKWQPLDKIYSNWWLRDYSSAINFSQTLVDKNSPTYATKNDISKWIIKELNQPKYTKRLIIATITNDAATDKIKDFCKRNNIETVDLFVDYSNPDYSHLPYDSHPNAKAHQLYFEKMDDYLEQKN
jgi:hypothetical protein